jgi:myotubularin-related protein 1/2
MLNYYHHSQSKNEYGVEIVLKDGGYFKFGFSQISGIRTRFTATLFKYAFPAPRLDLLFAFFRVRETPGPGMDGWRVYSPAAELQRMGITEQNIRWRVTEANLDFGLCETYPRLLVVPRAVTDSELVSASAFRGKERLPVLSWRSPTSNAVICRSAQPKVGVTRARSVDDEALLRAIKAANPDAEHLLLFDCRPKANALANQAMGAGTESLSNYPFCLHRFQGIENIHVVRSSMVKLQALCANDGDDPGFLTGLSDSKWLEHLRTVLAGAVTVARAVHEGASCLVHCSDGWDRTPQVVSLAMLMLDPYFRTLRGFQVLIEKEWVAMGHKFTRRTGHGSSDYSDEQRSPIFTQFMDAVFQFMTQHPQAFEFTDRLLIVILDNLYACRFGTFLFSSVKEAEIMNVQGRTSSLWTEINERAHLYLNRGYLREPGLLVPNDSVRTFTLWYAYHFRYNRSFEPLPPPADESRSRAVSVAKPSSAPSSSSSAFTPARPSTPPSAGPAEPSPPPLPPAPRPALPPKPSTLPASLASALLPPAPSPSPPPPPQPQPQPQPPPPQPQQGGPDMDLLLGRISELERENQALRAENQTYHRESARRLSEVPLPPAHLRAALSASSLPQPLPPPPDETLAAASTAAGASDDEEEDSAQATLTGGVRIEPGRTDAAYVTELEENLVLYHDECISLRARIKELEDEVHKLKEPPPAPVLSRAALMSAASAAEDPTGGRGRASFVLANPPPHPSHASLNPFSGVAAAAAAAASARRQAPPPPSTSTTMASLNQKLQAPQRPPPRPASQLQPEVPASKPTLKPPPLPPTEGRPKLTPLQKELLESIRSLKEGADDDDKGK